MFALRHLLYAPAVVLAWLVVTSADESARLHAAVNALHSLAGTSRMAWASLLETMSLSLYQGASDYAARQAEVLAAAAAAERRALLAAWGMLAVGALQCAVLTWPARASSRQLAWHALLASMLAFAVGVSAPLLTVAARAEVPVLGMVVLDYDSKSLLSVVTRLANSGNWLLATLLGVFSFGLPLIKSSMTTLGLLPSARAWQRAHAGSLAALGRWSLTDVFVVAVLVAFLAADQSRASSAEVGLGLYFFVAYCLLSQLATYWMGRPGAALDVDA